MEGLSLGQRRGATSGPLHPRSPRPGLGREGEGALVPLQVGVGTALPLLCICVSALCVLSLERAPPDSPRLQCRGGGKTNVGSGSPTLPPIG